ANAARGMRELEATILDNGEKVIITGRGTGPVDGFVDALTRHLGIDISVVDYSEHTLRPGADASAICYMEVASGDTKLFGVGINPNIVAASLEALVSAVNRM
ncbi:MAG: alpha-isopropylmalate synthase regulatory domain-containing protein, partial [Pseudomonadota bacterium]